MLNLPDFQFYYYMAAVAPRLDALYISVTLVLVAWLLIVVNAMREKIITRKEFLRKMCRVGLAGIGLATLVALTPPKETWIGMYNGDPVVQSILQSQSQTQQQAQQQAEALEQAQSLEAQASTLLASTRGSR